LKDQFKEFQCGALVAQDVVTFINKTPGLANNTATGRHSRSNLLTQWDFNIRCGSS